MDKWARALYHPCLPLGDHKSLITGSEKHIQLSLRAATEGCVLLKNKDNVLPLDRGTKVAVFGKAQIDYVKGGGGSGDVHCAYIRNIYEGLKMYQSYVSVFDELSLFYQDYVKEQYQSGKEPGMFDEAVIPSKLLAQAKAYTDTAIITINRYSQEDVDRRNDGTDTYFYLSDRERDMVDAVTSSFAKVIVLLNAGAVIDTSWVEDQDSIFAAVMLGQGGMEGGLAAADILTGKVNPSGRLVDTFARTFDDYPSSEGFHESDDYVKYHEDIFVGYRYFETIPGKKDCVVYPFGYGLSYTTFTLSDVTATCIEHSKIVVSVKVTNTGVMSGKEVVQVYYQAPEGKLSKAARELCGFAKTEELKPGESQSISVSFAIKDMASYDDQGLICKSCYVMEKGDYQLYIGQDVRKAQKIDFAYTLEEDVITEQLTSYCAPELLDKRMKSDGTYEMLECKKVERKNIPNAYKCVPKSETEYKLIDVAEGKIDIDSFLAQLTDQEVAHLLGGHPNTGVANCRGMGSLPKWGVPSVMTTDGPAGVRIEPYTGIRTTAFPVATALACTWNLELLEEVGKAGALEVKENNMQIWLTPALNIHRSPLCGRNFEYFSEDPFVSGKMAAAMTRGIQSENIVACPKHLACNNKETNRYVSDSIVSERALREIYLRGFQICVEEAEPKMIMTAYNILNGVRTSENMEMLEGILRGEWGFKGMFTTDWCTKGKHARELKAGNDIKMFEGFPKELQEALDAGELTREDLCVCAKRILEMILWLE